MSELEQSGEREPRVEEPVEKRPEVEGLAPPAPPRPDAAPGPDAAPHHPHPAATAQQRYAELLGGPGAAVPPPSPRPPAQSGGAPPPAAAAPSGPVPAWTPLPPSPVVPAVPTAVPTGSTAARSDAAPPDDAWFWCPTHLIASEREGRCPVCSQPFLPAPPWGIPAGPYRPPSQLPGGARSRKERLVYGGAIGLVGAVAVAAVLGLVLLYRHGTPLAADGSPQTSASDSASGSAASAAPPAGSTSPSASSGTDTASGTTSYTLSALDNRSLVLPGSWQRTTTTYSPMQSIAKALTPDSSQPNPDLQVRHNAVVLAVYAVANSDPAGAVASSTQAQDETQTVTGGTITVMATTTAQVAGRSAVTGMVIGKTTAGKTAFELRYYLVATTTSVVLIEAETSGPESDIDPVATAVGAL